ncbi:MAG: STAS domain-containing protein [Acidipila sp.]|nr:STAS domain-containing protein [Acidipila sp.]
MPKSVVCLRDYDAHTFLKDLVAGVTVGLVALPLAMAFAIASGLTPQAGIYCAIVTGFIISALGGSRVQIGGPTGAFVVVVAGIIATYGVAGLFMCTMMAGVLLVLAGLSGLGSAVKFIPRPVVVGFTNGIALLIASTQIKDFFGISLEHVPAAFLPRMAALARNFSSFSVAASLLALVSLLLLVLFSAHIKRAPGMIVVLFCGTAAAWALGLHIETIGSRFGGIPQGLPHIVVPQFHVEILHTLLRPAITIAVLGAIESLMSAVVADRMTGDRHNPNVELIAQGFANIVSPLFGGLPATGAIARTATNVRSGGQTPLAGMIHAVTLLGVLLFAAPLARFIPLAVLAAILMMVSYNMGEWGQIPELLKLSTADISVWLVTLGLTVMADLSVAVEVGMILAALLYIRKVTITTTVTRVTEEYIHHGRAHSLQDKVFPPYLTIFRIHGPFLFGATDKISAISDRIPELPQVVILRLRNMNAIDATGVLALERLAGELHASGRAMILCGAMHQPARLMKQAEFEQHVGRENICANIEEALARAEKLHASVPLVPANAQL